MKEKLFRAYARVVAFLFPQYCIRKKTLKTNGHARDYLPSLKAQKKVIRKLSDQDISKRFWSAEALEIIFHKKYIFWENMTDFEFYHLNRDFESIRRALAQGVIEKERYVTIVGMHLSNIINSDDANLLKCFEYVAHTYLQAGISSLITEIAGSKVTFRVYRNWLKSYENDPSTMPAEFVEKMLPDLFGRSDFNRLGNFSNATLEDGLRYGIRDNAICNELVWLSIAYHKLDDAKVYNAVLKSFDGILSYLAKKDEWTKGFVAQMLWNSRGMNFNFVEKLYKMSDTKPIGILCESAEIMSEIVRCADILAANSDADKERYHTSLIAKAVNTCYKTPVRISMTSNEKDTIIYIISKCGISNHEQMKQVAKILCDGNLTEDQYNALPEKMKEYVLERMELNSQFDLVNMNPAVIIENEIRLLPEAEKLLFMHNKNSAYWLPYVDIFELSEKGYKEMVLMAGDSYIEKYTQKYGFTDWQYRFLLQSSRKYLAPKLKQYCK